MNALNSRGYATRPTGAALEAMVYYPFGSTWQDTTGAIWDERFAGMMIHDADFDQYATPNRQNSPSLGRWMTPDPAGMAAADPANPQSWNRYAYVLNNPANGVDPSGLQVGYGGDGVGDCYMDGVITSCSDARDALKSGAACLGSCSTSMIASNGRTYRVVQTAGRTEYFGPNGEKLSDIDELGFSLLDQSGGVGDNGPVVLNDPCSVQGRALPPGAYASSGQQAGRSTTHFLLDVAYGWPRGGYLDAQPLASGTAWQRAAYGNYVYGAYMAAAGVSLTDALGYADLYHGVKATLTVQLGPTGIYPPATVMDRTYTNLPAANVSNITNGYNAEKNGMLCGH